MTSYLSQFDLLQIRTRLARTTGERFDLFNLDGLLSALAAPRQTMFGEELHPSLLDKAAILFFLLIKNHPFYDGNKRIALTALRNFLLENGVSLAASEDEGLRFARTVATASRDATTVRPWLEQWVRR